MDSLWIESAKKKYIVHPHMFNLWLFIIATTMIFGGLTSAFIVARSFVPVDKQVTFDVPGILWQNTLVVLFSSATMQYAVWASRREEVRRAVLAMLLTFGLGLLFAWGQLQGWQAMVDSGLPLVNRQRVDSSVSFFYVYTGLHAVHILGTMIFLLWVTIKAWFNWFKMDRRNQSIRLVSIFWHYLTGLWIYLFGFMLFTQG